MFNFYDNDRDDIYNKYYYKDLDKKYNHVIKVYEPSNISIKSLKQHYYTK